MMEGHSPNTLREKLSMLPNTLHLSNPGRSTLIARETCNKMDLKMTINSKIHCSIDIYLVHVLAWALYSGLEVEVEKAWSLQGDYNIL